MWIMMTSSNGNILCVTGHLCGEFTGEFAAQRPVTRSFVVYLDLRLNKQLSKQLWGCWIEMPSHSLWRHCNNTVRRRIFSERSPGKILTISANFKPHQRLKHVYCSLGVLYHNITCQGTDVSYISTLLWRYSSFAAATEVHVKRQVWWQDHLIICCFVYYVGLDGSSKSYIRCHYPYLLTPMDTNCIASCYLVSDFVETKWQND